MIVGGGQAGLEAAAALRTQGFSGSIALVCEEPHEPYQRPPLSKDYLLGKASAEKLPLRSPVYYENHHIDLMVGQAATKIDRVARRVHLSSGRHLDYDHLILAVGARNRLLNVPGAEQVLYLRSRDEAAALRDRIAAANRVVVIGGGFIGLEVAAAARVQGKEVTVLETMPRLMARAVAPVLSKFFLDLHVAQGVNVLAGTTVASIEADEVITADGKRISAHLVVAGIGVIPNTDLAAGAGLAIGDGIAVDQFLRTSDPNIFAIGDCAEHPNKFAGAQRTRLESVQNAVDQAKYVARAIVGDSAASPYQDVPWFWTDQYDVRFQMAGLSGGSDQQVQRGSIAEHKFSIFYFKAGALIAVDSVNRFGDHIVARKLLAGGTSLTSEQAADETVDLKKLTVSALANG